MSEAEAIIMIELQALSIEEESVVILVDTSTRTVLTVNRVFRVGFASVDPENYLH